MSTNQNIPAHIQKINQSINELKSAFRQYTKSTIEYAKQIKIQTPKIQVGELPIQLKPQPLKR